MSGGGEVISLNIIEEVDFLEQERLDRDSKTPKEFIPIKRVFERALEEGVPVLLETTDMKMMSSIVIDLVFVGDYFSSGEVTYSNGGRTYKVPYTINYANVFVSGYKTRDRVIFKGENPYEKFL